MAHFKLLQHPLGKTKGSVLLSTVKYTHPPSSSSALPLSSQPAQELQSSPTAWRVRFTPGPVPGTPTLAVEPRLGKDAALEQHTHAVWIPSECHLLHAGIFILFFFFPDFPQAAEFLARQHLQATQQPAICLHLFMFTKNFALFSLPGKLVVLSKKAISCLLYYLP